MNASERGPWDGRLARALALLALVLFPPALPAGAFTLFRSADYVKTYPGPPQRRADVALLVRMDRPILIRGLDERTIESDVGFGSESLEILPGAHRVRVRYSFSGAEFTGQSALLTVELRAEAGHVYGVYANQKGEIWSPALADITSSSDKQAAKAAAKAERAFVEYRRSPQPTPTLPVGFALLVNMHGLTISSIDEVATPDKEQRGLSRYFRFVEGRHALVAGWFREADGPPTRLEFTALRGHVYALMWSALGNNVPYAPCVVDITGDLDNVKANLAEPIGEYLRK